MPWFFPEFLKKRACRYLLQHYLGQFLEEKISLDDLTIDLYNGTGAISNVPLNVEVSWIQKSKGNLYQPVYFFCSFVLHRGRARTLDVWLVRLSTTYCRTPARRCESTQATLEKSPSMCPGLRCFVTAARWR